MEGFMITNRHRNYYLDKLAFNTLSQLQALYYKKYLEFWCNDDLQEYRSKVFLAGKKPANFFRSVDNLIFTLNTE
jgi:hypothetical protein